jgi:hypothetical protein
MARRAGVPGLRGVWTGKSRTLLFVFGGLLVLQASDVLDVGKLIYLVVAVAVILSAAAVIWVSRGDADIKMMRPWLAVSAAFAVMLAISLPVALTHGTGIVPWVRNVASYGLFAAAPLIAIDARRSMTDREIVALTLAGGTLAAVSFSVAWLARRSIADFGIGHLLLPSAQFSFVAFAVGLAVATSARRVLPWCAVSGAILGLLLVTGTRTTLLLTPVILLLAAAAGRVAWKQVGSALFVTGCATAAVVVLVFVAVNSRQLGANDAVLPVPSASAGDAVSSASALPSSESPKSDSIGGHLGSIGELATNPASEQSLRERIAQSQVAFQAFLASPLLGSGPGQKYSWTNASGVHVESSMLDTPLMLPAAYGLVGIAVAGALVGTFFWFLRILGHSSRGRLGHLAFVGLAGVFGVTSILGAPMDDKGAAYGFALVLALAANQVMADRHTEVTS